MWGGLCCCNASGPYQMGKVSWGIKLMSKGYEGHFEVRCLFAFTRSMGWEGLLHPLDTGWGPLQLGLHPIFQRLSALRHNRVVARGKEVAEDLRERWETSDSPFVHRIQVPVLPHARHVAIVLISLTVCHMPVYCFALLLRFCEVVQELPCKMLPASDACECGTFTSFYCVTRPQGRR